jgi:hypothetical protein
MEIIIGLIVIGFAAALFFNFRKKDEPLVVSAPYKVEDTPAPVVEPEAVVVVENAVVPEAVVAEAPAKTPRKPRATKTAAVVEKKPVAKKPVAKKPAAKKPAARKPVARSVTKSKKV